MRRASQDYAFIIQNGVFIGIALGHDFCAEHEWGIKDLRRIFGIPEGSKKNMGIASRIITACPPLVFKEGITKKVKHAILYTTNKYYNEEQRQHIPYELNDYVKTIQWNLKWNEERKITPKTDALITAWNSGSFGVAVYGNQETEYLKDLHEQILNLNLAILTTKFEAFRGSSLCLLITDRIPQSTLDSIYKSDKECYDLIDYEESIGMTDIKNKFGNKNGYHGEKYFMACSPKWLDYEDSMTRDAIKKEINTQYDIRYWINYSDNDNNYGWYTVEEIREWLTGDKKLVQIRKGH